MCPSVVFLFNRRIDCLSVGMGVEGERGKRALWSNFWELDSPPKLPLLMVPVWVCALRAIYTLLAASLDSPLPLDSFLGIVTGGFCFLSTKAENIQQRCPGCLVHGPTKPAFTGLVPVNGREPSLPLSMWAEGSGPLVVWTVHTPTSQIPGLCLLVGSHIWVLLFLHPPPSQRQVPFTSANPTGWKN